ncbi:Holliday junction resolvase RuvX [Trueperella sp. LYQ143]|uniref:Holliday junction resolvase RuvX n=1 Tax=unclassified Trueperella TaxID=2630174 RepID=UPI003982D7C9
MRSGARIGVDLGDRRIGIARCDAEGIIAMPVATIDRGRGDIRKVVQIIKESDAIEVIVGLPRNMDGSEGESARKVRYWAGLLSRTLGTLPVRMVDERLSTVQAHRHLHEAGRREKSFRSVVDQQAAVIILDDALAYERANGCAPGELVEQAMEE